MITTTPTTSRRSDEMQSDRIQRSPRCRLRKRTPHSSLATLSLAVSFFTFLFLSQVQITIAADITLYCKCLCGQNITIITVDKCTACTKAFCLETGACHLPPPTIITPTPNTTDSSSTSVDAQLTVQPRPKRREAKDGMGVVDVVARTLGIIDFLEGRGGIRNLALAERDDDTKTTTVESPTATVTDGTTITSTGTTSSVLTTTSTSSAHRVGEIAETGIVQPKPTTHHPEDEWVVLCFQPGSYKDEVIVTTFLLIVLGLLLWIVIKPYVQPYIQRLGSANARYTSLEG
ncbi:hypothetical protein HDU76_001924 [Blyttiomyces sp. JEL0837]|nr:hypothetical protein HDU76_001924 [Blyttiomyces sp. JEL0837]